MVFMDERTLKGKPDVKNRKHFSNAFPYIIFITLIFFYLINNYIWFKNSVPVPIIDPEAAHLSQLVEWYFPIENLKGLIEVIEGGPYSPLYYLTAVLSNRLLGTSLLSTRMANIFWLIIILISVYKLGEYLFNKEAGLLAAIILSFYPAVYGSSRLFREEFGLMGMVPLSMLFLFKSEGFKNLIYSLLFGIIFGVGLMVKAPFIIFITGPMIYILIKSITSGKERKSKLRNFFLTFIIIILIIFPRFSNQFRVREYLLVPFSEQGGVWYKFDNLRVFTLGVANYQITPPLFLLFLFGFYLFLKRVRKGIKIPFLLWIFVPLIFLTLMPHRKLIRHIIPCLPVIALISGFGVTSIKKKIVKRIIIFLIIFIGLVQYYELSFGMGIGLDKLKITIFGRKIPYFYNSYWDHNCSCHKPFRDDIYKEVVSYVNKHSNKAMKTTLLIPPSNKFDVDIWRMFFWFGDFPFKAVVLKSDHNFIPELVKTIKEADFVLFTEEEANLGFSRYFNQQAERVRYIFVSNFLKEELKRFEHFLQNDYMRYKKQYLKEINAFEIAKRFKDERGMGFYLLERINP